MRMSITIINHNRAPLPNRWTAKRPWPSLRACIGMRGDDGERGGGGGDGIDMKEQG